MRRGGSGASLDARRRWRSPGRRFERWRRDSLLSLVLVALISAVCVSPPAVAADEPGVVAVSETPTSPPASGTPSIAPGAESAPRAPEMHSKQLTRSQINRIKDATAALGVAVLLWGAMAGRARARRGLRRGADAALVGVGLLAALCWWDLGQIPGRFAHVHEFYHYYVGAKYFPELGYNNLYRCVALADLQIGRGAPLEMIRSMRSYRPQSTQRIFAHPERCEDRFSSERWQAFRNDVGWFERQMSPRRWRTAQWDHGYNATPTWGILGTLLTGSGPVSWDQVTRLALIDPVLLGVMWSAVWWAFGWRATCAAVIYWGTTFPAEFTWTGGGYLRQDWLMSAVVGLCLLRKRKMASAGILLTTSALLRIFPALIVAGIVLKALAHMLRVRRLELSPEHRRFAGGCIAALLVLVPLSSMVAGRADVWSEFVSNSRVHTERYFVTSIGLVPVLSWDSGSSLEVLRETRNESGLADVELSWENARQETFSGRRPIYGLLVVGYLALLTWAVRNREDWVVAAVAIGSIPMLTSISNYYYGILLGMALLTQLRPRFGIEVCAVAALTRLIPHVFGPRDETYAVMSALICGLAVLVAIQVGREPTEDGESQVRAPS